jgi:hypothetical protein
MKRSTWIAALLAFASASAWSLVVDERRDGDLPDPRTIFSPQWLLDPGPNTVLGSVTASANSVDLDFDAFVFAVPNGFRVRAISLTVQIREPSGISPGDSWPFIIWDLTKPSFAAMAEMVLPPKFSGPLFRDVMPLLPGTYELLTAGFIVGFNLPSIASADYRLQFQVVSCPRPSTLSARVRAAFGA